ncbi:hypothetical protein LX32DRAFT_187167 [Colletotrichum zoysiae]|uniref:Uncharacterized protein n=1 Tax=Colletotrichum zoysiae TaxID=1216348 RepID=A0AAD9LVG0_9PEZI|nr:hypothetical protein LX32DRAFT_187167 [Colletotrichum zoysiae]
MCASEGGLALWRRLGGSHAAFSSRSRCWGFGICCLLYPYLPSLHSVASSMEPRGGKGVPTYCLPRWPLTNTGGKARILIGEGRVSLFLGCHGRGPF